MDEGRRKGREKEGERKGGREEKSWNYRKEQRNQKARKRKVSGKVVSMDIALRSTLTYVCVCVLMGGWAMRVEVAMCPSKGFEME